MAYGFALCRWRGEGSIQWAERLDLQPIEGTPAELAAQLEPWALGNLRARHESYDGAYRALLVELDENGNYDDDFVADDGSICADIIWFYGTQHVPIDLLTG
jgi:hypothetical protein